MVTIADTDDGPRVETDPEIALGILGTTPGNGHPYSFASILNGYSNDGFARSEWNVIHDYLRGKDAAEFGFDGVAVTHAWTQNETETDRLRAAARIPETVANYEDLTDAVDAVVIARGDHEAHAAMATPFLEAGLPVFVDKPLSLDPTELSELRPYLETGQLTSTSGMRNARELDEPRAHGETYGDVRLARGAVINDWAHYGVHMLDAIFPLLDGRPLAVTATTTGAGNGEHTSATIETDTDTVVRIDALGDVPMTFAVDLFATDRISRHHLRDNFTAFRRTLWHFVESIRAGEPAIDPEETMDVLRTLITGRIAADENRPVRIDEVEI